MRTGAVTVIALFSAAAVLTAAATARPRWRRRLPKVIGLAAGGVLAAFLVGRGVAEFFIVHYGDPASYRNAWGGPSLAGVFAVHSGPAVAILLGAGAYLIRRHRTPRAPSGRLTSDRVPSGRVPSGRVPSGRVPSGRVPSGRVPSGRVPSGRVPSGRVPSGRGTSGPGPSDRVTSGRATSRTGPSGTGSSGPGAGHDVRPLARTGGHQ
jgi:MFS family permease